MSLSRPIHSFLPLLARSSVIFIFVVVGAFAPVHSSLGAFATRPPSSPISRPPTPSPVRAHARVRHFPFHIPLSLLSPRSPSPVHHLFVSPHLISSHAHSPHTRIDLTSIIVYVLTTDTLTHPADIFALAHRVVSGESHCNGVYRYRLRDGACKRAVSFEY